MKKKIYYEYDEISGTYIGLEYEKYLHQSQSNYQNIEILNSKIYGNVMYLDGCFMLSEKNQDYYHDACINIVPSSVKKILIIGGGDNAIASMLAKSRNIKSIDVVEIDSDIIKVSKEYFPKYFKLAKQNSKKIKYIIEDGMNYVKNNKQKFDCIIIDSTDPINNAKVLFSKLFLIKCYESLKTNGVIIQQSGSPIKDRKKIIDPLKRKYIEIGYTNINLYNFPMPLYPTGTWSFIRAKRA